MCTLYTLVFLAYATAYIQLIWDAISSDGAICGVNLFVTEPFYCSFEVMFYTTDQFNPNIILYLVLHNVMLQWEKQSILLQL